MTTTDHRVARAYDALAREYDAQLERDPVATYMRARLHAHFVRVFREGDRVLDLTAGTGMDACFLASQGIRVTALDISSAMTAELQRKVAQRGVQIDARVLTAERLSELPEYHFDGVISTFAGLSTIEDLPRLAYDLSKRVKRYGHAIFHTLNVFCFWEWAANLVRGHPFQARRVEMRIGTETVYHHLYSPFALWRDVFASYFELREAYGLSILAAPAMLRRWPRLARPLFWMDHRTGLIFPGAGDFFVLDLRRRDDQGL